MGIRKCVVNSGGWFLVGVCGDPDGPSLQRTGDPACSPHPPLCPVPTSHPPQHLCTHLASGGAPSGLCQLEVGFCCAPLIWTQDPGLLSPRLRPSFWKFCQTFHFIRQHLWLHVEWRTPASGFTPAPTSSVCGSLIGAMPVDDEAASKARHQVTNPNPLACADLPDRGTLSHTRLGSSQIFTLMH